MTLFSWREFRIPLPGDINGVVVLMPDKPLTPEQWDHFKAVLGAMRPALVDDLAAERERAGY